MNKFLVVCSTTLVLFCLVASSNAQPRAPPSAPTPAPAPAPDYVNLTQLLSVAGPFHTFLQLLQSSKVLDTFQNQANNTEEGITIFVPKDEAFSSLRNAKPGAPSLANLTQDQIKSLCLFHALPHYYSLADFRELSQKNPITTYAGGPMYVLNVTYNEGTIRLDSGWTRTKITSAVHSTDPVALYQTDKVLLPEAIFGTDIPPMPAPAPAPEVAPAPGADADAPAADRASSNTTSRPHSSSRRIVMNSGYVVVTAIIGGLVLLV